MNKKNLLLCILSAVIVFNMAATSNAYALTSTTWKEDYGFYQLNKNTREVYKKALSQCRKRQFTRYNYKEFKYAVKVSATDYRISENQIYKLFITLSNNHPEFYWISNRFVKSCRKDGTVKYLYILVEPQYNSYDVRNCIDREINSSVNKYIKIAKKYKKRSEKVLAVNNEMKKRAKFAYTSSGKISTNMKYYAISGLFVDKKATCQGYTKAFQYILNQLGIKNIYVTGRAGGEPHCWNLVEFDGKYYPIDVTWNDMSNTNYYFALPAKQFNRSHTPGKGEYLYTLPSNMGKSMNYNMMAVQNE